MENRMIVEVDDLTKKPNIYWGVNAGVADETWVEFQFDDSPLKTRFFSLKTLVSSELLLIEQESLIDTGGTADNYIDELSALNTYRQKNLTKTQLKEIIAIEFGAIKEVLAVYLYSEADHFIVDAVLATRDRSVRDRLFEKQLMIYDELQETLIRFTVSFDQTIIDVTDDESREEIFVR